MSRAHLERRADEGTTLGTASGRASLSAGILRRRARFHSHQVGFFPAGTQVGNVSRSPIRTAVSRSRSCAPRFHDRPGCLDRQRRAASIGRALHFSETRLQWVITAYAITFGGSCARRSPADSRPPPRFYVGVTPSTFASFLCWLARSEGALIAHAPFRARCRHHPARALLIIMTTFHESRAQQGARHLGRDRLGRRRRRRPAACGEVPRLGMDLLRQRACLRPGLVLDRASSATAAPIAASRRTSCSITITVGWRCSSTPRPKRDSGWATSCTNSRLAAAAVLLVAFLVIKMRR